MSAVRKLADSYGVPVRFSNLGDWGADELRSEYDPDGPVIRVSTRITDAATVEFAIAHELYHHREHIGEVPKLPDRSARERAADAYARSLVEGA